MCSIVKLGNVVKAAGSVMCTSRDAHPFVSICSAVQWGADGSEKW